MYGVPLNVSKPSGERIVASVEYVRGTAMVRLPYLKEVEADAPKFAKNGVIAFSVEKKDYEQAMESTSKYLESLFLKELNNADTSSSIKGSSDSGRDEKLDSSGEAEEPKVKRGSSSLRDRSRGRVTSESDRGRNSDADLAESSSQES